ncbi:MAG: protease SohB [Gammaproteobacteria bacterium]|nr:MAG: protease SohB [Gammaproteobacteria bacterium]|tara:strand:- start:12993 stop:14000 length:1008 start_codon:yes stop_codon:yes gene_type:complete
MLEIFSEYGLFLLKVITILISFIVLISFVAASKKNSNQEGLDVENLNKKYKGLSDSLNKVVLQKDEWKAKQKDDKAIQKNHKKQKKRKPKAFVLDFLGDIKASAVPSLREEVTAILDVAKKNDQIILRLDNHGGVVHEHGLAASQLARIRQKKINLVVVVDKVAASGGYLMACVANKIYAAPFAILGSIGVIAQLPNFNRLLDNYGVDFEQVTAGQYKRNVTMFGKNTDEDREKLKEQLEEIHSLFKSSVNEYRPELNLDKVATGEYWYGKRALELGLIDEIKTSDELLLEMSKKYEIFSVKLKIKQPLKKRIMSGVDSLLGKFEDIRWSKNFEN